MRIAVVFCGYDLGISVQLIETIRSLAASGALVDVFIADGDYAEAPAAFASENVRLILLPKVVPAQTGRFSMTNLRKTWLLAAAMQHWLAPGLGLRGSLASYFRAFEATTRGYMLGLEPHFRQNRYAAVIGIEGGGLTAACRAVELWQPATPVICYNMELQQHNWSMHPGEHLTKHLETICVRRCRFTVIADENRGAVFARANGVDPSTLRYLPVSTAGEPVISRTRFFQERFQFPDETVIVLYAGNITSQWAMGYEVVQSVRHWPNRCVLVMHSWRRDIAHDPYFQQIRAAADPQRVFFSLEPVPSEQVPGVLSSAHIGLAFYRPLDENCTEIGSSSNKLAQYARVGLPVITNRLPSIEKIFGRFGSGRCVDDPQDTGPALEIVLKDYERYRQGAFASYQGHYDFSVHFAPLLREIQSLAANPI